MPLFTARFALKKPLPEGSEAADFRIWVGENMDILDEKAAMLDDLKAHQEKSPLDHPDNSVTDAKIGNRTINQGLANPQNTGTLTSLLSWLAGRIRAIMGTTNWYDAPPISLLTAKQNIQTAQSTADQALDAAGAAMSAASTAQQTANTALSTAQSAGQAAAAAQQTATAAQQAASAAKAAADAAQQTADTALSTAQAAQNTANTASQAISSHASAAAPHSGHAKLAAENTFTARQRFGAGIQDGDGNQDVSLVYSVQHHVHTRTVVLTYDGSGRLQKVEEKDGAAVVKEATFNYDGSGRLTSVSETAGGVTVTATLVYDGNGRLAEVQRA